MTYMLEPYRNTTQYNNNYIRSLTSVLPVFIKPHKHLVNIQLVFGKLQESSETAKQRMRRMQSGETNGEFSAISSERARDP